MKPILKIKSSEGAIVPKYQTEGAAAFDLHANLPAGCPAVTLFPGQRVMIPTGIAVEVPNDHVLLVFSRSGHGAKHGATLANSVGVIDPDYRDQIYVALTMDGNGPALTIENGQRIAQAMLMYAPRVALMAVSELSDTARGKGGFGSTGQ